MTSYRIKEIQEATAYPYSHSVSVALHTVWNETLQEINQRTCENCKYYTKEDYCLSIPLDWNYHGKPSDWLIVDKDFGCNKWRSK